MTMTLSLAVLSLPHVLYATGTSLSTSPLSNVKEGTVWNDCSRVTSEEAIMGAGRTGAGMQRLDRCRLLHLYGSMAFWPESL